MSTFTFDFQKIMKKLETVHLHIKIWKRKHRNSEHFFYSMMPVQLTKESNCHESMN